MWYKHTFWNAFNQKLKIFIQTIKMNKKKCSKVLEMATNYKVGRRLHTEGNWKQFWSAFGPVLREGCCGSNKYCVLIIIHFFHNHNIKYLLQSKWIPIQSIRCTSFEKRFVTHIVEWWANLLFQRINVSYSNANKKFNRWKNRCSKNEYESCATTAYNDGIPLILQY